MSQSPFERALEKGFRATEVDLEYQDTQRVAGLLGLPRWGGLIVASIIISWAAVVILLVSFLV